MSDGRRARGAFLREAREAAGLTLQQAASAVLDSGRLQTVHEWEKGTKGEPTADQVAQLSQLYGFDVADYIRGGTSDASTRSGPELRYAAIKRIVEGATSDGVLRSVVAGEPLPDQADHFLMYFLTARVQIPAVRAKAEQLTQLPEELRRLHAGIALVQQNRMTRVPPTDGQARAWENLLEFLEAAGVYDPAVEVVWSQQEIDGIAPTGPESVERTAGDKESDEPRRSSA